MVFVSEWVSQKCDIVTFVTCVLAGQIVSQCDMSGTSLDGVFLGKMWRVIFMAMMKEGGLGTAGRSVHGGLPSSEISWAKKDAQG